MKRTGTTMMNERERNAVRAEKQLDGGIRKMYITTGIFCQSQRISNTLTAGKINHQEARTG